MPLQPLASGLHQHAVHQGPADPLPLPTRTGDELPGQPPAPTMRPCMPRAGPWGADASSSNLARDIRGSASPRREGGQSGACRRGYLRASPASIAAGSATVTGRKGRRPAMSKDTAPLHK